MILIVLGKHFLLRLKPGMKYFLCISQRYKVIYFASKIHHWIPILKPIFRLINKASSAHHI